MNPAEQLDRLAAASAATMACPPPALLAAYLMDELSPEQHAELIEHLSLCGLCGAEILLMGGKLPPPPRVPQKWAARPRPARARTLQPFLPPAAPTSRIYRSSGGTIAEERSRFYQAEELTVELRARRNGDYWDLFVYLKRDSAPAANCKVRLVGGPRSPRLTSPEGQAVFEKLSPGSYGLRLDTGTIKAELLQFELPPEDA